MSADKKDQALHKQMSVFMWYISKHDQHTLL